MSIFRDTFKTEIATQLEKRQEAMMGANRTPEVIQYLHSRNSWIRMSSSVNVNGTNDLAKQYILLGGTLNNGALRSGVGGQDKAYSNFTPSGKLYGQINGNPATAGAAGLRPMPGITSIDVKSKSAYGSLREVVVNFQCWNIQQLEDLEILYMRPGYTVLIEWGWYPYLNNSGKLETTPPSFFDIINKGATNRQDLFKELYNKGIASGGNYEAMFGYIKNYQWSARPDGGYDCQATVISTGEIIESLKVNYVLPNLTKLNTTSSGEGFLNPEFSNQGKTPSNSYKQYYEKNILAGMWAELYDKLNVFNNSATLNSTSVLINKNRIISGSFPGLSTINTSNSETIVKDGIQCYITLEATFDILNNYVIAKSGLSSVVSLSLYSEDPSGTSSRPPEQLLCLAHPLQVSVDPTVCLIKSPLWYGQGGILSAASGASAPTAQLSQTLTNDIQNAINDYNSFFSNGNRALNNLVKALKQIPSNDFVLYGTVENLIKQKTNKSLQDILNDILGPGIISRGTTKNQYDPIISELKRILSPSNVTLDDRSETQAQTGITTFYFNKVTINITQSAATTSAIALTTGVSKAFSSLQFLKNLPQEFFIDGTGEKELGIIKNIWVNLDFLYKLSLDANIESQDKQEKNNINLYKYLKSMISAIQVSIGNINNFEIHVDPIDNKARIIDVNYTGDKTSQPSLFQLEVQNTKSVVRSYSLQSQIFPEQSSMIAISSQAKGGVLGMQNNTMIDFNKNLTDRILPQKDFAIANQDPSINGSSTALASNLGGIIYLFSNLATPVNTNSTNNSSVSGNAATVDLNTLCNQAKNNLKDLIAYFQTITSSNSANRNIIPIKFSFEMDGIGGLVIGHLFKINEDILPNGYKGNNVGVKLAQTITGIGHTVSNSDWVTKIDALNIVLDGPDPNKTKFLSLDLTALIEESIKNSFLTANNNTGGGGGNTSCAGIDKTNRSGKWKNLPVIPYQQTSVNTADVANYLKSKGNSIDSSVKRATYAIFIIESGNGKKGINNNYIGLQTDGGGFISTDANFVKGSTTLLDSGGNCRAFATYNTWQECIDHLIEVMKSRKQGSLSGRQIVPTNPDDSNYFGTGYASNWVGLFNSDPRYVDATNTAKSIYVLAKTLGL